MSEAAANRNVAMFFAVILPRYLFRDVFSLVILALTHFA